MADRRRPMRRRAIDAEIDLAASEPARRFTVEVRLFAWLAELAQTKTVSVELSGETRAETVVTAALKAAGLSDALGVADSARLAVNHEYANVGTLVRDGDELALIPPVSGGAPPHVRVTDKPIELAALHEMVKTERSGAVVVLTGCARGADRLHYEVYVEMAETRMRAIADQLMQQYRLEAVAIEHRCGDLPPGESAVVVAISAQQPPPAFAAAREAIDRVRSEVPVWRLECAGDYRSWVRGEPGAPQLRAV